MHSCPRCGNACDCSGDLDDIEVMNEDWVWENCGCCCDDDEEEYPADEEQQCPNCKHWNKIPIAWHECEKCNHALT